MTRADSWKDVVIYACIAAEAFWSRLTLALRPGERERRAAEDAEWERGIKQQIVRGLDGGDLLVRDIEEKPDGSFSTTAVSEGVTERQEVRVHALVTEFTRQVREELGPANVSVNITFGEPAWDT